MFSFLFGKKKPGSYTRRPDKTWVNQRSKYNGLYADLASPSDHCRLVVSYFRKTFQHLQHALDQKSLPYTLWERTATDNFKSGNVWLLMADQLENRHFWRSVPKGIPPLIFHFVEHYPRWSHENSYLQALEEMPAQVGVQFYNSLDEPLFQKFGGDNIIQLMGRFGMQDDECITHKMIDRSIKNMQKKIDSHCPSEIRAQSMEEWMSLNTNP